MRCGIACKARVLLWNRGEIHLKAREYKKVKIQKIQRLDMYIYRRLDIYLKSISIRQLSALRCTEALRCGRACKARVLLWNRVEIHLIVGEYKKLKIPKIQRLDMDIDN